MPEDPTKTPGYWIAIVQHGTFAEADRALVLLISDAGNKTTADIYLGEEMARAHVKRMQEAISTIWPSKPTFS